MRKVIVNSTPLIELCHVNQLTVLKQLYGEITIPKAMFKSQLHDGEVEVMILAMEQKADVVVIDDQNAKKYAKYLELPVTGTLGVLMKAKQKGYLSELKPVLDVMAQNGIYIKPSLVELCLKSKRSV